MTPPASLCCGVPRYFFHMLEAGETPLFDEEGEDLSDFEAAKVEGLESLRDLVADRILGGRPVLGLAFEVRDEAGTLLQTFSALDILN
jgi:uncharacterized protein DUF6894